MIKLRKLGTGLLKGERIAIFFLCTLMVIVSWVGANSAHAYPFLEVEGFANPGAVTDNGDGTSSIDVDYTFNVITADGGFEMVALSLEFEADVFDSVGLASDFVPIGWTAIMMTSTTGNKYEIALTNPVTGTPLGTGDSLKFTVSVDIFNAALTDSSLWTEGQIWGQSWDAADTSGFGGDGGSTAPVPEPATLLLLGSGLLGCVALARLKGKKTNG